MSDHLAEEVGDVMKIRFKKPAGTIRETRHSVFGGTSEIELDTEAQVDIRAVDMTAAELCLMRYRCAALSGMMAWTGEKCGDESPSWNSCSHQDVAYNADDLAQAMLKLDEEEV